MTTKAQIALCDDRIVSFSHTVAPQPSKSRSTAGSSSSLSYVELVIIFLTVVKIVLCGVIIQRGE